MITPSITSLLLLGYPKAVDCTNGHIGETILTWYWENDDDRGYLMKVSRCSHCHMPNGPDEYATIDEQEAYYRGEEPNSTKEVPQPA